MHPSERRSTNIGRTSIDGFHRPTSGPQQKAAPVFVSERRRPQPIQSQANQRYESRSQDPEMDRQLDSFALHLDDDAPNNGKKRSRRAERRATKKANKAPWSRRKKITVWAIVGIAAIAIAIGAWVGFSVLHSVNKVFHGNILSDAHALFATTKLKGEDQGRVNILFAGDSAGRTDGGGGADLTDSIMLVSIDTKNKTGFMLSIPRDLWVYLPGFGSHQKINAANEETDFNEPGFPKGGMGALESVVQNQLGIPVNYYALVNYDAFKDAVNAVGGITINVQSRDPRGLYDASVLYPGSRQPLIKLPNGTVNLNGDIALNLARARGDAYGSYGFERSDFDRTEHQRQMLVALEQKALTGGVLASPVKVTQLFGAIGNNVQTDLSVNDGIRLAQLVKDINVSNMQSLSFASTPKGDLLTGYMAPNGQDALIPVSGLDNFTAFRQYYASLVTDDPVAKEGPSVTVLNATNTAGLARSVSTTLQTKEFTISGTGDANNTYTTSVIIDLTNGKKPASKQVLQQILGSGVQVVSGTSTNPEAQEAKGYTSDFVVVIGSDHVTSSSTSAPH